MRPSSTCALSFFLCLISVASGRAQPNVVRNTPLIFGNNGSFGLLGGYMDWQLISATWTGQWTVGTCVDPPGQTPTNPDKSTTLALDFTGSLTMTCTAIYTNGSGGQTKKFMPSLTVNVPPPDGIRILSGDGVSKPFGQVNPTLFQITCKGQDCKYMVVYIAQERITNSINPVTNIPIVGGGYWSPKPGEPGGAAFAYSDPGLIADQKKFPLSVPVSKLNAGTVINTCTQEIQIILADPCIQPMAPILLGTYTVTTTKDTQNPQGGTYKYTHKLVVPQ
jgi:hypothetical protein